MIEIFDDIPERVREQVRVVFDLAIRQKTLPQIIKVLKEYTDNCINEREQEFADFYFSMRMEELLNENHNDQW